MSITISKYLSLKTRALPWACPAFCLLQLRHCPSRGHVGLFSLHMPRFSLTLALILLFSGHGDPFLLHMPRFSLTQALTLLFSGHDNSFHSPTPLTLFSPQKKIRSINLSIITLFLLTCATLQVSSVRVSTSLRRMLLEKSF